MSTRKGLKKDTVSRLAKELKKVSKPWAAFIVILAISIPLVGFVAFGAILTPEIDLTPDIFTPIQVDSASFKVMTVDGTPLETKDGSGGTVFYHDPTGAYPDVSIFYSEPFPCYSDGTYSETANDDAHTTSKKLYVDGKLYVLTDQYFFGVDIGARTYANDVNWKIAPEIVLSPLRGFYTTYTPWYGGSYVYGDIGPPTNPDGNLIMAVNTGQAGWPVSHYSKIPAKITTSLVPMGFQVSSYNAPVPEALSYAKALEKIQDTWGIKALVIEPNVTVIGLNDYVRYSYDRQITLDNGTKATVSVDTTSAKVGFASISSSTAIGSKARGIIPNALSDVLETNLALSTEAKEESKGTMQVDQDVSSDSIGGRTLEGYIEYQDGQDVITTVGAAANVYSSLLRTSLTGRPPKIDLTDLDHFSLDEVAYATSQFKLQPVSTIYTAKTNVHYEVLYWNGATIPQTFDWITDTTSQIMYPYKLSIQNVYAISRIVFRVVVLSENNPVVKVNGKPVDPDSITDFELTEYGLEPDMDDFRESPDFPAGMLDVNTIVTIVVVVVIVAVGILLLFLYFKFRTGTTMGGGFIGGGGSGGGGRVTNVKLFNIETTR